MRQAITGLLLVLIVAVATTRVDANPEPRPRVVPWAWHRPEDLRFLDANATVAYLAMTVTIRDGEPVIDRRLQPLALPPGIEVIPVVRIESGRDGIAALSGEAIDRLAEHIASLRDVPRAAGVQIDFDARRSERAAYRALLTSLRDRVGTTPLTITALASWCLDDGWIADLPIDRAIPMLFRMGRESDAVRARLRRGERFRVESCRDSVGLSTDEPFVNVGARTIYVFHPKPWTRGAWLAASARAAGPER